MVAVARLALSLKGEGIFGISPFYARSPATTGYALPSEADLKAFNDRRIEIVKIALQLTPAQEKCGPPSKKRSGRAVNRGVRACAACIARQ